MYDFFRKIRYLFSWALVGYTVFYAYNTPPVLAQPYSHLFVWFRRGAELLD